MSFNHTCPYVDSYTHAFMAFELPQGVMGLGNVVTHANGVWGDVLTARERGSGNLLLEVT